MQRILQFIIVSVSIAYYIVVFRFKCFFSKILKKAFIQNRTLKRIYRYQNRSVNNNKSVVKSQEWIILYGLYLYY